MLGETIERRLTMTDPNGMHARSAALFVKAASRFDCEVTISNGARSANGKSILGILTLCIGPGERVSITAEGSDAAAAIQAIQRLFMSGFQEEAAALKRFVAIALNPTRDPPDTTASAMRG
jgi:phosphotransferase system HPr (HPr) family protein